jgi:hypothetical protein
MARLGHSWVLPKSWADAEAIEASKRPPNARPLLNLISTSACELLSEEYREWNKAYRQAIRLDPPTPRPV